MGALYTLALVLSGIVGCVIAYAVIAMAILAVLEVKHD